MSVTIHTSLGDIKCEIFCELVPKSAKNFLALCAKDYYNETLFHRNIKGFIIQGGDPTGTGKGGNSIYGKYFEDEFLKGLEHDRRGILSMANSGQDTNGSQFFITYNKLTDLDSKYTVFGKVIDGFNTLDKMEREPVGKNNKPLTPIAIKYVTIHSNPIAENEYNNKDKQ